MRFLIIILIATISTAASAQQTLVVKVTGDENKSVIAASILIKGIGREYVADTFGTASISFNSNGSYTLVTSAVGLLEGDSIIMTKALSWLYFCKQQGKLFKKQTVSSISTKT